MHLKPASKIKYLPIRYAGKKLYYFDGDKIVAEPITEAYKDIPGIDCKIIPIELPGVDSFGRPRGKENKIFISGLPCDRGDHIFGGSYLDIMKGSRLEIWEKSLSYTYSYDVFERFINGEPYNNRQTFRNFTAMIREGDTYNTLADKLEQAKIIYKEKMSACHRKGYSRYESELDRFITKFEKPIYIRMPENTNKNTFDFIKMHVNICSEWPDREKFIKKNLPEIIQITIQKLEDAASFKKFGVPIGCLALTEVWQHPDSTLEFVFELKKELQELGETNDTE